MGYNSSHNNHELDVLNPFKWKYISPSRPSRLSNDKKMRRKYMDPLQALIIQQS
jgi:hypothetical protein